ncbi:MAG: hypothetical protein US89_C0013G0030 [Candidatus Peregrinibacteria bacterium GW2011_GWF2_38_29]|nr:MAG: hypothetical protein US89_C0013G0030 [Candidatus Peregrinibacteria bacterium GW2011_GWF2_38_29]HBB02410.1 hypothetical protein [Candidatus Peregrinibacteria bacterium]
MNNLKKNWGFVVLIVLDLFMTGAALTIDYRDFVETPFYLWIFVPICSLYPLLLAVNYAIYLWRKKFVQWLLNFTAVGIISYSLMALVFYSLYMYNRGFAWYEFGNIFWVLLYGSQIFVIWKYLLKIHWAGYASILIYFIAKDFLDRFSATYSYQRYGILSSFELNVFFVAVLVLHIFAFIIVSQRKEMSPMK